MERCSWNDYASKVSITAVEGANNICMMVVDNVSFHHVKEVVEGFAGANWLIKFFPPNMTDELQPMDLVVNSVLKCEMRKLRIAMVFDSIQQYRTLLSQWSIAKADNPAITQPKPLFHPPKPSYKDAVRTMLQVHKSKLTTPQFVLSLSECFKKVGLVPMDDKGEYNKYREVKLGVVKKEKCLDNNDCVAGWCIDISTRRDDPSEDAEYAVPVQDPVVPVLTPVQSPSQVPVVPTI